MAVGPVDRPEETGSTSASDTDRQREGPQRSMRWAESEEAEILRVQVESRVRPPRLATRNTKRSGETRNTAKLKTVLW